MPRGAVISFGETGALYLCKNLTSVQNYYSVHSLTIYFAYFPRVDPLTDEEIRKCVLKWLTKQGCCYGSGAAKSMQIKKQENTQALHVSTSITVVY